MWQKKLLVWAGVSALALGQTMVNTAEAVDLPVQAEVVTSLTVTPGDDLAFGSFVAGAAGTITVNPDGVTATNASDPGIILLGNDQRGTVTVNGSPGVPVEVTVTLVAHPTDGSSTMALSALTCTDDGSASSAAPCSFNMPGVLGDPPVSQLVGIGGTLTVANGQAPNVYNGTISVTAAFSPGP